MMSEARDSVGNQIQMDRTAINDIANSTVLESKIACNVSEAKPELRYHGETPIRNGKDLDTPVTKIVKRSCTVLSPVEESNSEKTVESSIKRSIDNLVPCILETIRTELRNTISEIVDAKISDLRN